MARPKAQQLTERELEIMQVFWDHGELTVADVREKLESGGRELAYTTVATLVKILLDKTFVKQLNDARPFIYKSVRSYEDVSKNILSDMIKRVFGGSREELLVRLMDQKKLNKRERELLESVLREQKGESKK
jgi:predicted transcriptional regulator